MHADYFVTQTPDGREVIKSYLNPAFEIAIYHLANEPFNPDPEKLQLYGDDYGAYLAFEMVLGPDLLDSYGEALSWYAEYIDYPQMNRTTFDPR
jgi:hypothetical protein